MDKIPLDYYQNTDTLKLAKDLIGKLIFTQIEEGRVCGGMITETEAYLGAEDKASHAYNNRRTFRTETMYLPGGVAYIYLCYGIHHLFNIVCNKADIPHAILIRGVFPVFGKEIMIKNTGKSTPYLLDGPGKLTKALGITTKYNNTHLDGNIIWLEDHKVKVSDNDIMVTPRVGIDYAGKDSKLPYRFVVKGIKIYANKLPPHIRQQI